MTLIKGQVLEAIQNERECNILPHSHLHISTIRDNALKAENILPVQFNFHNLGGGVADHSCSSPILLENTKILEIGQSINLLREARLKVEDTPDKVR